MDVAILVSILIPSINFVTKVELLFSTNTNLMFIILIIYVFIEKALMILYVVQLLNRLAFWLVASFNSIFIFFFTPITTLQVSYVEIYSSNRLSVWNGIWEKLEYLSCYSRQTNEIFFEDYLYHYITYWFAGLSVMLQNTYM